MKLKLYKIWKWIQSMKQGPGFILAFAVIILFVLVGTIWGHLMYDHMNPSYKCPLSDNAFSENISSSRNNSEITKDGFFSSTQDQILSFSNEYLSMLSKFFVHSVGSRTDAEGGVANQKGHDWGIHAWITVSKYPLGTILLAFFIVWAMRNCWKIMSRKYRLMDEDERKSHLRPEDLPIYYPEFKGSFIKNIKGLELPCVVYCKMDEGTSYRVIDDENRYYELPEIVKNNYSKIFLAHRQSSGRNDLLFRLDTWSKNENTITFNFSRVMFFDFLVTNRAIDYPWESENPNLTLRKIFFGTGRYRAEDVPFANHLGVNGYIITKDKKLIVSERSHNSTIGRFTMESSVGAKLRARNVFGEDGNGKLTVSGLEFAIKKEVERAFYKEFSGVKIFSMRNVKALYAALFEGAKPQFFFVLEVEETASELIAHKRKEKKWLTFSLWQIQQAEIRFNSCLIPIESCNGSKIREYFINSNTAASLELFREYLVAEYGWIDGR